MVIVNDLKIVNDLSSLFLTVKSIRFYRSGVKKKPIRTISTRRLCTTIEVCDVARSRRKCWQRAQPTVGICGRFNATQTASKSTAGPLTGNRSRRFECSVDDTRVRKPSRTAKFVIRSRCDRVNAFGAIVVSIRPYIIVSLIILCTMYVNNKYINIYVQGGPPCLPGP